MPTAIVGVDAATQAERTGLAFGVRDDDARVQLERVEVASPDPARQVAEWLGGHASMAQLLAVDAPLGWPSTLGPALCVHRAGHPLGRKANELFRRRTDDFIHETLGKRPLDVGADRIARTAHAALAFLDEIRMHLGLESIPLAWDAHSISAVQVIEVYPAATLKARGWPDSGYKKTDNRSMRPRQEILGRLGREIHVDSSSQRLMESAADALDAALCMLAADDFLSDCAIPPSPADHELARREGWIWVRDRRVRPSQT